MSQVPLQVEEATTAAEAAKRQGRAREESLHQFFIDNLLVRIHFIIVMIRWTGLAPWEFEFPFPVGGGGDHSGGGGEAAGAGARGEPSPGAHPTP